MFWVTGLVGIAFIGAPWVFNYTNETNALWASVIIGAIIVLVSAYKAFAQDIASWEYWIAGLAGIAAIAAPFVLNFTALTEALWTLVILGAFVAIVSSYEVFWVRPGPEQRI